MLNPNAKLVDNLTDTKNIKQEKIIQFDMKNINREKIIQCTTDYNNFFKQKYDIDIKRCIRLDKIDCREIDREEKYLSY